MAELAKEGISKNRKNVQQGYNFRGVDDIYNSLATLLSKNGIVIRPFVVDRQCVERQTQKGGVLYYTTVTVDYTVSCEGQEIVCRLYGEAMDSADKSTNKAMSAAYKYLCLQLFCIPTEGDNDADLTSHEVAPSRAPIQKITQEQIATIREWIAATNSKEQDLLNAMGVANIAEIKGDAFANIIAKYKKKAGDQ